MKVGELVVTQTAVELAERGGCSLPRPGMVLAITINDNSLHDRFTVRFEGDTFEFYGIELMLWDDPRVIAVFKKYRAAMLDAVANR